MFSYKISTFINQSKPLPQFTWWHIHQCLCSFGSCRPAWNLDYKRTQSCCLYSYRRHSCKAQGSQCIHSNCLKKQSSVTHFSARAVCLYLNTSWRSLLIRRNVYSVNGKHRGACFTAAEGFFWQIQSCLTKQSLTDEVASAKVTFFLRVGGWADLTIVTPTLANSAATCLFRHKWAEIWVFARVIKVASADTEI